MISIIICSKNKNTLLNLTSNIQKTIGCKYELVVIDNSQQQYSIFSAYNAGVEKSVMPYLCFVHEDVEFLTDSWGEKLINHLKSPKTGFIGVAGGEAMLRVPFGWPAVNGAYNITHSTLHQNKIIDCKETFPAGGGLTPIPVVLLDGVFLATTKNLFQKIRFDEHLSGFHGYDLDISLQAIQNGYSNYVVFDIDIKHFSKGKFDRENVEALLKINAKWEKILPVFEHSYTPDLITKVLHKAEKSALKKLRRQMVRSGMSLQETLLILKKYSSITGNKLDNFLIHFEYIPLIFIKISSMLRGKMIYK